jgi:hemolysin III
MNLPFDHSLRLPGLWERRLDSAIHAIAIAAALVGAVVLIMIAAQNGPVDVAVAAIYSGGLLAMFGCSLAYNLGRWSRYGDLLRGLDQTAIFLMIAGTYTPFTILRLDGAWGLGLTGLVWSVAALGIALRLFCVGLFDRFSISLYLALGWIGVVALAPLIRALDVTIVALLAAGGILYTVGVAFHLWERLPFRNAIWHAFVLAGAGIHFAAVAGSFIVS